MASPIYQKLMRRTIESAIAEYRDASDLDHTGLVGQVRELAAERIIRPMLPAGFEVGTGKVTDAHGRLSAQIDLIIHSRSMLPPIMHSERDGVIAAHSTYYAVEVKSKLSATAVRDALRKAHSVRALDFTGPGDPERIGHVFVLFAFDSDLAPGSSEVERLKYYAAEEGLYGEPISAICVAGRGYYFIENGLLELAGRKRRA
jgi:hypothetical protein